MSSALTHPVESSKLREVADRVDLLATEVDTMVNKIVENACAELDGFMHDIDEILTSQKDPVTDTQLEDFTLNLPSILYFVSASLEDLGIKEDVSRAVQKEVYNRVREKSQGTVADKDAAAELQAQAETIVNIVYSRAYRKVKLRIEAAWEMLNSVKKVMTRRVAEMGINPIQ